MLRFWSGNGGLATAGQRPYTPEELAALLRRLSRRERRARLLLWIWATATLLWLMPLGPLSAAELPPLAAVCVGAGSLAAGAALIGFYRACSRPYAAAGQGAKAAGAKKAANR